MTAADLRKKARETLGGNIFHTTWLTVLVACFLVSAVLSVVSATIIGTIILWGPLSFGLSRTIISTVRTKECKLENLITGFKEDLAGNIILGILQEVFIFLWSLLFVIPGIIKAYAYSMAFYIKADHPEYTYKQCLDESQKMMKGNKFRLFCLHLSFIGWIIVGSCCFGIGLLWVQAYMQTAVAHFYEDLRTRTVID
jgi:uncharacterized membrane protein